MTPKAAYNFDLAKYQKEFNSHFGNVEYRIETTSWIYMNMSAGWTEEECDNVVYIIDAETK